MRNAFPRVYRSFEEFEREELHKLDVSGSIDDMLGEMFAEELDSSSRACASRSDATRTKTSSL
jgi:hypothetical protein